MALAFVYNGCKGTGANEPETTSTSAPASEASAGAEEPSAPEPQAATSRTADKPKQALGDFGEPGQFESTTPRTTEPVEPSEPASGENIQTIPAPAPDSAS